MNWLDVLGWSEDQIEDLRFVGFSYIKQGLYDTALVFFEALIVLSPDHPYDLKTLGALYLQKGNALQALHFLDRSLKIEPKDPQTMLNRAKSLFALGYKKRAIMEAQKLKTSQNTDIAKQANALVLSFSA